MPKTPAQRVDDALHEVDNTVRQMLQALQAAARSLRDDMPIKPGSHLANVLLEAEARAMGRIS